MTDGGTPLPLHIPPSVLKKLDDWRHLIPFWWWLAYDSVVGIVIAVGLSPSDPFFWLGFAVLFVATVIDLGEFLVKRPGVREKLKEMK